MSEKEGEGQVRELDLVFNVGVAGGGATTIEPVYNCTGSIRMDEEKGAKRSKKKGNMAERIYVEVCGKGSKAIGRHVKKSRSVSPLRMIDTA